MPEMTILICAPSDIIQCQELKKLSETVFLSAAVFSNICERMSSLNLNLAQDATVTESQFVKSLPSYIFSDQL